MATFTSILTDKDTSATEKLASLNELVTAVRKSYGNADVEIDVPYVNTTDGMVSFKYLDDESKVHFAGRAIKSASMSATEACESTPGLLFDKEIEWLVATDAILCNLTASTGSKYI